MFWPAYNQLSMHSKKLKSNLPNCSSNAPLSDMVTSSLPPVVVLIPWFFYRVIPTWYHITILPQVSKMFVVVQSSSESPLSLMFVSCVKAPVCRFTTTTGLWRTVFWPWSLGQGILSLTTLLKLSLDYMRTRIKRIVIIFTIQACHRNPRHICTQADHRRVLFLHVIVHR